MRKLRCASYTRKSSEEGLDQSFNSLDAQHEACAAYVASQKGEGWTQIAGRYDDGGWSGGSMDRPALKRLLADVATGRVDIIVVYKVDRLTRSLADFAKMVELFDKHGVSFVSVTQAFNTTTSMGRLTLNVLLSFAQFEREVTSERIRDKIAASKAKGMWMGGYPPLGYDPDGRTLVVNEPEAETVRYIFRRYLELGSVHLLAVDLADTGITSKRWTSAQGRIRGGVPLGRGALFHMLRNRLYLGEIVHKDKAWPGQHEPIVEPELFETVQARLAGNTRTHNERTTTRAPLTGLLFDAAGHRMSPAHARGHSGQRYVYYVSAPLQAGRSMPADMIRRVAARVIEPVVIERLRRWSNRPTAGWAELEPYLVRVELCSRGLVIHLRPSPHEDWAGRIERPDKVTGQNEDGLEILVPATLSTRGGRTWLIGAGATKTKTPDKALVAGLRRAHAELARRGIDMTSPRGPMPDACGMGDPYLRKLTSLAFLAPDIQRAILEGRQPPGLTLAGLLAMDLPMDWAYQREALGFGAS